jgi:predicted HD phosphohydrolase
MSDAELAAYRANPHAGSATQLRRFDEAAKVRDLATPPVAHFLPYVAACEKPAGQPAATGGSGAS